MNVYEPVTLELEQVGLMIHTAYTDWGERLIGGKLHRFFYAALRHTALPFLEREPRGWYPAGPRQERS